MLFNKKHDDDAVAHDYPNRPRVAAGPVHCDHAQPAKSGKAQTRSVIDACLVITGTVEGDGELQIDGKVQGDIRCTHLTVGRDATVDGNVAADEVVVRGKVRGVIGANRVILMDSAHVESDIFHKKLAIEDGATFDGVSRCREHPIDEMQAIAAGMKAAAAMKDEARELMSPEE
jgi:cytoskeletal protein CcmA (bactofilin family)